MMTFDVVLVRFPFSDAEKYKKRPALILHSYKVRGLGTFYIICMITSQVDGIAFPHDILVEDLESAGLPIASLIRPVKIVTVEGSLILKKLGHLSKKDISALSKSWAKLFPNLD